LTWQELRSSHTSLAVKFETYLKIAHKSIKNGTFFSTTIKSDNKSPNFLPNLAAIAKLIDCNSAEELSQFLDEENQGEKNGSFGIGTLTF